jgi:hypothetical protein
MSVAIDTLEHMFEHEGMPAAPSTLRTRADFDELASADEYWSGGFDGPGDEFDDFPVQGATALAPQPSRRFDETDAAEPPAPQSGADRVAELQTRIRSMQATKLDSKALPTLDALRTVLPGGLREGATYTVEGSTALLMAMLAGPSAAGSWVAVVGMPDFGAEAAARFGIDLDRLVLVPHPGDHWLTVTAAVADVVTVVVVRAAGRVSPGVLSRLEARLRERGAVLVVQGAWPHSDAALSVTASAWGGLGVGHGHLAARQVTISATERKAAGRPRSARIWLPAADAAIRAIAPAESLDALAPFDAASELARLRGAVADPAEQPFEPTHPFELRPLPPRAEASAAVAQPLRLVGIDELDETLDGSGESGAPVEWKTDETDRDREPTRSDDRPLVPARGGIRYRGVGDPVDDRLLAIERRPETERAEDERMRRAVATREAREMAADAPAPAAAPPPAAASPAPGAAAPAATDRHKQRRGFDAKQERALKAFAAAQEAAAKLGRTPVGMGAASGTEGTRPGRRAG